MNKSELNVSLAYWKNWMALMICSKHVLSVRHTSNNVKIRIFSNQRFFVD